MHLKAEGLSHGLKTCHRHVFLTAFGSLLCKKFRSPRKGNRNFGARVLIGLFRKCARTNTFLVSCIFEFDPHPYRMRLKFKGLSHELRKCPPDTFLPSLRSGRSFESHLSRKQKYLQIPVGVWRYLVREMGLEPTRRSPHAPQTCLSTIPTLSQLRPNII